MTATSGITLVYGATGTQGSPVAEQLLAAGRRVRVLTRDASRARALADLGAEVAVGDLADAASLAAAHQGVDRVALHLPLQYDFDLHELYGRNAIQAAQDAGVSMLAFNTSAHVLPAEHVTVYRVRQRMVDELRASGVPSVVIQPTFYFDIFLGPWIRPGIVEQGVVAFPLPSDFPMSWVSAQEAGAYMVAALDRPDLAGRTFDVGGPEALTGEGIAERLAGVLGRPVGYYGIDPDAYEQAIAPIFGPAVAFEVAQQVRHITSLGSGAVEMAGPRAALGVEPVTLARWAARQAWGGAPAAAAPLPPVDVP